MASRDLTSMLNQLRRSQREDAARDLTRFVWETAYQHAQRRLGDELRGRIGPTDIVNNALNSAFRAVENAAQPIPNRDWFEGLVKTIITRRINDAVDHAQAIRRDIGRETGEPVETVAHGKDAESSEQAIAGEFSVRLAENLLDEPSEERRLAVALGSLAGYKPGEIHEVLARTLCKETKAPAARTIQVWLSEARHRVETALGVDLDD